MHWIKKIIRAKSASYDVSHVILNNDLSALIAWYSFGCICVYAAILFLFVIFRLHSFQVNWMVPWKNRISSTTRKLRKSLIKLVTWQKLSSLPPEIVMQDTFILWTSADICVLVHDDLRWKNWTTLYNCMFSATSLALRVIFVCRKCPPIYASCMTISGGTTKQHIVIGFRELAAAD